MHMLHRCLEVVHGFVAVGGLDHAVAIVREQKREICAGPVQITLGVNENGKR